MKKIITILLFLILINIILGNLMEHGYKKYWEPLFDKLDVVFRDSSQYDIVFLGDSRTHFGINPYYIDSITKLKSFNAGMGGANIKEMYFLAEAWLKQHKAPSLFVVSVGYSGILELEKTFENPSLYFFYTSNQVANKYLTTSQYHTSLFSTFPFLKYTAFDDYNKICILRSYRGDRLLRPGGVAYKGFINNNINMNGGLNIGKETKQNYQEGIEMYKSLLNLLVENNCKVLILYPPIAPNVKIKMNIPIYKTIDTLLNNMAYSKKIPIIRFDTDTSFHANLFGDIWHLNLEGTKVYSIKIADDIQSYRERINFNNDNYH